MPPITRAQLEARLQLVEELEQLADDVHAEPAKEVLT
jgi:hypothetical protein